MKNKVSSLLQLGACQKSWHSNTQHPASAVTASRLDRVGKAAWGDGAREKGNQLCNLAEFGGDAPKMKGKSAFPMPGRFYFKGLKKKQVPKPQ